MERPYILWTGKLPQPLPDGVYRLVVGYGLNNVVCEISSRDAMNVEFWTPCPAVLADALKVSAIHTEKKRKPRFTNEEALCLLEAEEVTFSEGIGPQGPVWNAMVAECRAQTSPEGRDAADVYAPEVAPTVTQISGVATRPHKRALKELKKRFDDMQASANEDAVITGEISTAPSVTNTTRKSPHTLSYCNMCSTNAVWCVTCGNNCCNGSYGKVDGSDCHDCASAYADQDAYLQDRNSIEFAKVTEYVS